MDLIPPNRVALAKARARARSFCLQLFSRTREALAFEAGEFCYFYQCPLDDRVVVVALVVRFLLARARCHQVPERAGPIVVRLVAVLNFLLFQSPRMPCCPWGFC